MPQLPKDFKNRKTLLIGTAAVLLVTALTFWNWKSTHKKDPSVKQKKSHTREAVKKEDKKKDVKQPKAEEINIKETAVKEETKTLSVEEQQVNAIEQAIEEVVEELIAEEAVAIETVAIESVAIESVAKEPVAEEPTTMETNDNETITNEPVAEASTTESQVPEEEKITDEAVIMEEQVTVEAVVEEKEKSVEISEEVVVVAAVSSHFDESSSTKSQPISTATSSTDETDIRTPEQDTQLKESVFDWTESSVVKDDDFVVVKRTVDSDVEADMPQFNTPPSSTLTASAPEFVPKAYQTQPKKSNKKYMTREQLIEQQRQHHIPRSKARCSHWPHCTNNNCKFFHPYKPCRAGDDCVFGERCMFVHPSDCVVPTREKSPSSSILLN